MASGAPSHMDLWPKLRRRIKECKPRKGKGRLNSCASRGLEKFSVVYAELQARTDSLVERFGAPVSMVRSMSRPARSRSVIPNNLNTRKDGAATPLRFCEEHASVVVGSESISGAEQISKPDTGNAMELLVENVEQGRDSISNATEISSTLEQSCNPDESVEVLESEIVDLVLSREISFKDAFCDLELRGGKGARMRRRSMCGREKRWRHVDRTAVALVVVFGVYLAEKSADLAGSILGVLFLGLAMPCQRRKQHLYHLFSAIAKYLRGPLHCYLSGLATKRLNFVLPSEVDEEKKCDTEASSPRNSNFVAPVFSSDASHPSSRMCSSASEDPGHSISPVNAEASILFRESCCSAPVSPVDVSPVSSGCSPTSSAERCLSPSNKLSQFKSKLLKSFPLNKAHASDVRVREFTMPSSQTCESYQGSGISHSERWNYSDSASTAEVLDVRSIEDRLLKKKSFLHRRSSLQQRNEDGASDISEYSRSSSFSSFSRSRFGKLRINISHSNDDFATTSSTDSPRTLRIGSLRISTSMRDSPRRSVDHDSSGPCSSPGQGKLKVSDSSKTEHGLRADLPTPRQSGLSHVASPCSSAEHEERRVCEMKRRQQKHEVWLGVIFLVALVSLLLGRVPAVLATSISVLFLSQLDKFKQSGGAGRDKDAASRRAMSISRKLRTSASHLSPRSSASPPTPCTPCRSGSSRSTSPEAISNECRRLSISIDQFFRKGKKS